MLGFGAFGQFALGEYNPSVDSGAGLGSASSARDGSGLYNDGQGLPGYRKFAKRPDLIPLKEAEKEIIREALVEAKEDEPGPIGLAASLLQALIQPYETNDRIDWRTINRTAEELVALRQGIAQYTTALKEQQEEDEDEEAILLLVN